MRHLQAVIEASWLSSMVAVGRFALCSKDEDDEILRKMKARVCRARDCMAKSSEYWSIGRGAFIACHQYLHRKASIANPRLMKLLQTNASKAQSLTTPYRYSPAPS